MTGDSRPPYVITDVRWSDIREVDRIQLASFRRGLAYRWPVLAIMRALPNVTFLVARDADAVIGCIIADIDKGNVRIMNIAVAPDWRKRGVGTALMGAIGDRLPRRPVVLMVEEHNRAAQALYERLGFTRTGFRAGYYGQGHHGIEMTLRR